MSKRLWTNFSESEDQGVSIIDQVRNFKGEWQRRSLRIEGNNTSIILNDVITEDEGKKLMRMKIHG